MSASPIRVLVVDDSAFARKVIREALSRNADMEVVGIAHDGLDALEKISELNPDVLTLDLVMPHLDGVGVLNALRQQGQRARVVVVSMADADHELVLAALESGAVDFVHKPTALATDRLYEIAKELTEKVRAAAGANLAARVAWETNAEARPLSSTRPAKSCVVVVGTSTGGPQALAHLLSGLPADFPAALAITLHIPAGYTEALAKRLDDLSALEVVEASDGIALRPGRAVIARAGWHLKLDGSGSECVARLDLSPFDTLHRPSVDVLFQSAAAAWGPDVLAVVMTGMGNDGLEGARAVRAAGGRVITEAASSSVIYGMPRCIEEAGLSLEQADLHEMASCLVRLVSGG